MSSSTPPRFPLSRTIERTVWRSCSGKRCTPMACLRSSVAGPRDPDDRFDNELVDGICPEAANEVAVDLEIVERQMLQVTERAEPGAEIIEREAAPPAPQVRHERLRAVDVANRRCFGQLEDQ